MKKLLLLVSALLFSGCAREITLRNQDAFITNYQSLPARVGLYIPDEIRNDSIQLGLLKIKTGKAFSEAIQSSVSLAVREMVLLDSAPTPDAMMKKSVSFAIVPYLGVSKIKIWPGNRFLISPFGVSTFRQCFNLHFIGKSGETIDTISAIGNGFGERSNEGYIDSIIGDAGENMTKDIEKEMIYGITRNDQLHDYLTILRNNPIQKSDSQQIKILRGKESTFIYDPEEHVLNPVANSTSIAYIEEFGGNGGEFSACLDVLFENHFSIRAGLGFLPHKNPYPDFFTHSTQPYNPDVGLLTMASYLFFSAEFHLEVGLGLLNDLNKNISTLNQQRVQPTGLIGYRYQSLWGGFVSCIGYTPYIDKQGYKNAFGISFGLCY